MAKTSTVEERVEALLRRGGRVRAPELVKLIHEINPTDLGLPPAAERRRYALKSRLQSLLIRQFPDEIVVSPMPAQEGVVALHYRPHDRDACHAVVSDLDDDARSFVRLQLDLAAEGVTRSGAPAKEAQKGRPRSAPAPASRSAPDDPRQLMRLGHEALEAYDFERAQACFEDAFSRSNGGTPEALALLEFLVDHLAAYPAALEHEARLSQAALRNERVRVLFAFAAANVGDVTTCRRFIAGTEGHHAAASLKLRPGSSVGLMLNPAEDPSVGCGGRGPGDESAWNFGPLHPNPSVSASAISRRRIEPPGAPERRFPRRHRTSDSELEAQQFWRTAPFEAVSRRGYRVGPWSMARHCSEAATVAASRQSRTR